LVDGLRHCIANNRSEDLGGGLFIWGEVPTTVSNTTFSGNQAAKGGAIYSDIWDAQLDIDDVKFDSNSASVEGGVLYTNGIRPVYIENSQISNNTAADIANLNSDSNISGITYVTGSPEPVVEAPVEEVPVEEPAVEAPVEEVPVEEPAVEAPVEEVPVEEPVVEAPVEEAPVEEPVVEAPVEEVPVEEPVVEAPVEEAPIEEPSFTSSGLELTQDAQFSGKPSYVPAENSGLFVWSNNDNNNIWNMEATGAEKNSHYAGRFVANQPIEDLNTFKLEANDYVRFVDDSHTVVEFSMTVSNAWTDGLSFRVSDNASVFLELENSEGVPVQVGASMNNISYVESNELSFVSSGQPSYDNSLVGGNQQDILNGGSGNDFLDGGASHDQLLGFDGDDALVGGNGRDTLDGGNGNDFLDGGVSYDRLFGMQGNDTLDGGGGRDILDGGVGNEVLTGGYGDDTFVITAGSGTDTITDFGTGNNVIGLSGGIVFSDLSFTGNSIMLGDETLAVLNDVDTKVLTEKDFVTI
jgi:predicted outer membrane repeat protein